jgi:hypothetical protein
LLKFLYEKAGRPLTAVPLIFSAPENSLFWQNAYFAPFTLACALRINRIVIPQSHMNNASFVRRHRLQAYGPPPGNDFLGHPLGQSGQSLFAPFTITLHINDKISPLAQFVTGHETGNELN